MRALAVSLLVIVAIVGAQWAGKAATALARGMTHPDTVWYHGPYAVAFVQRGRLIFDLFPNRLDQIGEFVRRLVVNILIGNGDAHLKNWSIIYRDKINPQLAPAYDLVSTIHYGICPSRRYTTHLLRTLLL